MGSDERLQACIDSLESTLATLHTKLSVLENIVNGNGRPGIMDFVERYGKLLDDMETRLTRVESSDHMQRLHKVDTFRTIGVVLTVIAMLAGWGFALFY